MKQKQMFFLGVLVFVIIGFFIITRNSGLAYRSLMPLSVFVLIHGLIFWYDWMHQPSKKRRVFFPSMVLLIPTLVFLVIFLMNQWVYMNQTPAQGGMNEDYSLAFLLIFSGLLAVSFVSSFIYWKISYKAHH